MDVITIGNEPGIRLGLFALGAAVHRLDVTGGDGKRRNVVLGHRTEAAYLQCGAFHGATIGRFANRIAGGRLKILDKAIELESDGSGEHLHGGPGGFHTRHWSLKSHSTKDAVFQLTSADGDQGYPGELRSEVRYSVRGNRVCISMSATCDAPTVVSLTNHSYFNLNGESSGTVHDHLLRVESKSYLPVDFQGIPANGFESVVNTPFDLRAPAKIGDLVARDHPQIRARGGLDHCFVLPGTGLRTAAVLRSVKTLTSLRLLTDAPGLQVYSGINLDGLTTGTGGLPYHSGAGIALEPQALPDSPNRPEFPSALLQPGETYSHQIEWRFTS
ncbi:aldose epimerase family protein [Nocardioides marmorisolisilvae]|uniref:Aldose 1-epimerase n=1 Tax=Nocardioides marmorisolisilvae TaxID=1542737 RepID=A0A3N0DPQ7_9ACTN|nr:aldose epimerase family protein [Nocardioides marmorisolisilvae]RNL77638.1 galactose mutarotase [Nocardioides marmorisolisilvae]